MGGKTFGIGKLKEIAGERNVKTNENMNHHQHI